MAEQKRTKTGKSRAGKRRTKSQDWKMQEQIILPLVENVLIL